MLTPFEKRYNIMKEAGKYPQRDYHGMISKKMKENEEFRKRMREKAMSRYTVQEYSNKEEKSFSEVYCEAKGIDNNEECNYEFIETEIEGLDLEYVDHWNNFWNEYADDM